MTERIVLSLIVLVLFYEWFREWVARKACPFCGAGWGSHKDDCYLSDKMWHAEYRDARDRWERKDPPKG